jgi:hypothetical protein
MIVARSETNQLDYFLMPGLTPSAAPPAQPHPQQYNEMLRGELQESEGGRRLLDHDATARGHPRWRFLPLQRNAAAVFKGAVRKCGTVPGVGTSAAIVAVETATGIHADVAGVLYCHRPHVCPHCFKFRAKLARHQLALAFKAAREKNWKAAFVTLTVPHVGLKPEGQRGLLLHHSARFFRFLRMHHKDRYGDLLPIAAFASYEYTYGGTGWHCHVHMVLFSPESLTNVVDRARQACAAALYREGYYRAALQPRAHHEFIKQLIHCEPVDMHNDRTALRQVGNYVTKLVALKEVTKAQNDGPSVRNAMFASHTVWELVNLGAWGHVPSLYALRDYERLTFNTSRFSWHAGSRRLLGIPREDWATLADAEAQFPFRDKNIIYNHQFSTPEWRVLLGCGIVPALIVALEANDVAAAEAGYDLAVRFEHLFARPRAPTDALECLCPLSP